MRNTIFSKIQDAKSKKQLIDVLANLPNATQFEFNTVAIPEISESQQPSGSSRVVSRSEKQHVKIILIARTKRASLPINGTRIEIHMLPSDCSAQEKKVP